MVLELKKMTLVTWSSQDAHTFIIQPCFITFEPKLNIKSTGNEQSMSLDISGEDSNSVLCEMYEAIIFMSLRKLWIIEVFFVSYYM